MSCILCIETLNKHLLRLICCWLNLIGLLHCTKKRDSSISNIIPLEEGRQANEAFAMVAKNFLKTNLNRKEVVMEKMCIFYPLRAIEAKVKLFRFFLLLLKRWLKQIMAAA